MMTMMPFPSFGRWHCLLYVGSDIVGYSKRGTYIYTHSVTISSVASYNKVNA